ncbi:AhpD-like protein [Aspergillus pseudoustus]|uniref:AhpD-like protein n=1 Tax=Aspergillus pseudoustus TaxID=1810923 RepID=A0ABR4K9Z5_9EURO
MRLPYVADPPPTSTPEEAEILARVQARRAPGGLLALDRALLHSFPVTDGWNAFIGAIRTRTSLTTIIRELIICRVAVLNGALYEWDQHSPLLTEGGLSDAALRVVRDTEAIVLEKIAEGVLSPAEGAVLRYTDAMTRNVTVPDDVFQAIREHFNDREIVEITATSAAYNTVSRFLVALDVGEKNH